MSRRIRGTSDRPRLYVFRSNKHIYAQIIDDSQSKTLVTVSSLSTDIKNQHSSLATCKISRIVGKLVAKECLNRGVHKIVFDRGRKLYHGRIQALAESAREEGIMF
uniref:ribosomal protein L18 n=1 Tax=Nemalion vermiculare TaxID=935621 RepID=UPI00257A944E|nr:ribosomal protein L18 [Nemalion vermiculare]WGV34445.1 ribosomal protein L18 [Nemalion vermiculare]